MMKTTKQSRRKGLLVHPDDLQIGEFYAVYGLKNNPNEAIQICGMAFKITAINLPFVIGKLAADPALDPITFDIRYLDFMRVSADFVTAQAQETPA